MSHLVEPVEPTKALKFYSWELKSFFHVRSNLMRLYFFGKGVTQRLSCRFSLKALVGKKVRLAEPLDKWAGEIWSDRDGEPKRHPVLVFDAATDGYHVLASIHAPFEVSTDGVYWWGATETLRKPESEYDVYRRFLAERCDLKDRLNQLVRGWISDQPPEDFDVAELMRGADPAFAVTAVYYLEKAIGGKPVPFVQLRNFLAASIVIADKMWGDDAYSGYDMNRLLCLAGCTLLAIRKLEMIVAQKLDWRFYLDTPSLLAWLSGRGLVVN